jgi:hypothetical protein
MLSNTVRHEQGIRGMNSLPTAIVRMLGAPSPSGGIRARGRGWCAVLIAVAVAAVACPVLADPIPISTLFSTGVDGSGNPISNGATDTHWSVTSSPTISGTANYYNGSAKAYRIEQWVANQTTPINSQWVSVPNGLEALAPFSPPGQFVSAAVYEFSPYTYTYATTFTLPNDFISAQIIGKWVCDNVGPAMYLNGVSKTFGAVVDGFQEFTISDGFQAGTNTLAFEVKNERQTVEDYNPTGLQVQVAGTYAVPEPSSTVLALIGIGLAGFACRARGRSRAAQSR